MSKNIIQYDLLISCPGDITNEIDIIEDAVSQFNAQFSDVLGISVRTKYWRKNSYAQSGGKPQALLNEQFVNDCDAAVAILWTRFGTPTDKYKSGTEEEIEIMLSSGKQVFMYFSNKPFWPSQIDEEKESYKNIQAFRDKYKDRGIYYTYSSDEEFKTLFFAHLSQYFLSEKRVAEVKRERHSELKIVGINQNQHINDEASIISFVPNTEMTISKYLGKIRELFIDINNIELEKSIELSESVTKFAFPYRKPVKISERQRDLINLFAKKVGFDIGTDFYGLGNLSQNGIPYMAGAGTLEGTEAEKEKYNNFQKLLDIISKTLKWEPIENAFTGKKCLKLAIQNYGTDIDEDVEISLRIPQKCLLSISEFPKFGNDEMGYLLNDCDMSELFGICSTSEYLDYDASIRTSHRFSSYIGTPPIFPEYPDYSDDFESELAEVFCYSYFDEGDAYILKLKIDYIKHNTTIAFPAVIFVKEPFMSIPYTITSKNIPDIISGEIKIK